MVKLVLVGGVIIAGLFALRHASRKGMTNRGGPSLQVVGRVGLTRNSLVAVVMVDERRYLVGAAETGINLLADLDAPQSSVVAPQLPLGTSTTLGSTTGAGVLDLDAADALDLGDRAMAMLASDEDHVTQRTGDDTDGPRIGPLDRLREMTVRSHLREPIRAHTDHPA